MNQNDEKRDFVEEIYLTEKQATNWLSSNTRRSYSFKFGDETVTLIDTYPPFEIPWPPLIRSDMDVMIDRSLAFAARFSGRYSETLVKPLDVPQPKRARKLERPSNAVWTLSRYAKLAICIHDDGTVVATEFASWTPYEYRVTPQGDFYCDDSVQDDADLTLPLTKARLGMIRDAARLWVKRAKGRKMPPGFRFLWRRFPKTDDVHLLW